MRTRKFIHCGEVVYENDMKNITDVILCDGCGMEVGYEDLVQIQFYVVNGKTAANSRSFYVDLHGAGSGCFDTFLRNNPTKKKD
jgi:hypothetical protein